MILDPYYRTIIILLDSVGTLIILRFSYYFRPENSKKIALGVESEAFGFASEALYYEIHDFQKAVYTTLR